METPVTSSSSCPRSSPKSLMETQSSIFQKIYNAPHSCSSFSSRYIKQMAQQFCTDRQFAIKVQQLNLTVDAFHILQTIALLYGYKAVIHDKQLKEIFVRYNACFTFYKLLATIESDNSHLTLLKSVVSTSDMPIYLPHYFHDNQLTFTITSNDFRNLFFCWNHELKNQCISINNLLLKPYLDILSDEKKDVIGDHHPNMDPPLSSLKQEIDQYISNSSISSTSEHQPHQEHRRNLTHQQTHTFTFTEEHYWLSNTQHVLLDHPDILSEKNNEKQKELLSSSFDANASSILDLNISLQLIHNTGWTKITDDGLKCRVWFNQIPNSTGILFRLEGLVETSFINVVSVMALTENTMLWVPSLTFPFRLGLTNVVVLERFGYFDRVTRYDVAMPWPFKNRVLCIHAWMIDDLERNNTCTFFYRSLEGRGLVDIETSSMEDELSNESKNVKLYFDGGATATLLDNHHTYIRMLCLIDLKEKISPSMLNVFAGRFMKMVFNSFKKQCIQTTGGQSNSFRDSSKNQLDTNEGIIRASLSERVEELKRFRQDITEPDI